MQLQLVLAGTVPGADHHSPHPPPCRHCRPQGHPLTKRGSGEVDQVKHALCGSNEPSAHEEP